MSRVVYAFELRGIQGYLFNTGRLKDMIYASELIDYVFGQPLDEALLAVGADPARPQPRRAGGAAYLVLDSQEQAQRLRDLWTLSLMQLLPGIELVDAVATGASVKDAVKAALDELQVARNKPLAQLPIATPLTALAPRTGQPAVDKERSESLDASTVTRRRARRVDAGLMGRFGDVSLKWPNNFEEDSHESTRFKLNADNFVGMLHLDGNGIGVLLRVLNNAARNLDDDGYIEAYRIFSTELENVTCEAARKATEDVLIPAQSDKGVIPARPLVLGGDDLTILVRGDLAVPFAMSYAAHFEALSVGFIQKLTKLLNTDELPASLTTSGGLVLVKPGFPFSQALTLAESFADIAKTKGTDAQGNKVAALSLYRIQGAVGDDANALFKREQIARNIELSLPAYALTSTDHEELPSLSTLCDLVDVALAKNFSKSRLRNLVSLLYQDLELAKSEYQRWRSLMKKEAHTCALWSKFESALVALVGELATDLPCSNQKNNEQRYYSPLNDLLVLLEGKMVSPLHLNKEANNDCE
ncbi:hypothetical protein CBP31_13105 [Oceanisphaera profunda]|uniref:Cas10/Cmr2 second palm domain-containing protein n=1 Tax=Oceanisphaera profunda TaxID=1416627 RepID=A0A1Y0D8T9_9GAMM|nr:hypothetical protein [Oceanisphaera profunda]ART83445.1 hypothetical protein CBP31_13105 [Oceanisphaera profunda]